MVMLKTYSEGMVVCVSPVYILCILVPCSFAPELQGPESYQSHGWCRRRGCTGGEFTDCRVCPSVPLLSVRWRTVTSTIGGHRRPAAWRFLGQHQPSRMASKGAPPFCHWAAADEETEPLRAARRDVDKPMSRACVRTACSTYCYIFTPAHCNIYDSSYCAAGHSVMSVL